MRFFCLMVLLLLFSTGVPAQKLLELNERFSQLLQTENFQETIKVGKKLLGYTSDDLKETTILNCHMTRLYIATGNYVMGEKHCIAALDVLLRDPSLLGDLDKILTFEALSSYSAALAENHIRQSNYIGAESMLRYALLTSQHTEQPYSVGNQYVRLLNFYMSRSEHQKAFDAGTDFLKAFENEPEAETIYYGLAWYYQYLLAQRIGRFKTAERALYAAEKALRNCKDRGAERYLGIVLQNLASFYYRVEGGDFHLADSFNRCAEKIFVKDVSKHPNEYFSTLINPVFALVYSGKFPEAAQRLSNAEIILTRYKLENNYETYRSYLDYKAYYYYRTKNFELSKEFYLKAVELCRRFPDMAGITYAYALQGLGTTLFELKDYAGVERIFAERNKIQLAFLKKDFDVLTEGEKLSYQRNNYFSTISSSGNNLIQQYPATSNEFKAEIFNAEIFTKSLILEHTYDIFKAINRSTDVTIVSLVNRLKQQRNLLYRERMSVNSSEKRIAELSIDINNIEQELISKSEAFRVNHRNINIDLKQIQNSLLPNEAAIEFVRFQLYDSGWSDRYMYAAYIIKSDNSYPTYVPLFPESKLTQLIDSTRTLRTDVESSFYRGLIAEAGVVDMSKKVYELVWSPLEPYLQNCSHIYYSPAGILHNIAFDALQGTSKKLIEKYQLSRCSVTRQVVRQKVNNNWKPAEIVLFGDPNFAMDTAKLARNYDADRDLPDELSAGLLPTLWPPLPGSRTEINGIHSAFINKNLKSTLYAGDTATESALKAFDSHSPQILHIATHGFNIPSKQNENSLKWSSVKDPANAASDPMFRSGIILAGANFRSSGREIKNNTDDGILTAFEIAQLDLSNTKLVVLSTCKSALGDLKENEGIFGLQRAFKSAGVQKMIISLWPVSDRQTSILMTSFYSKWLEGKTLDEAFKEAQMELIITAPAKDWAAFVLLD